MEFSRYSRSYLTSETVRFTLQVEKFSMHALKGYYLGPTFQSGDSGSSWSLVVYINGGNDYGSFIDVRLKRECYLTARQYVNAKLSIVDCFGRNAFSEDRDLSFVGDEDRQVLSVAAERVSGHFGLRKRRFLLNDSLMLQCELIVSQDIVLHFLTKEDYERNLEESDSVGRRRLVEHFTHSRMARRSFSFYRRIDDFPTRVSCGSYVCPDYRFGIPASRWTLSLRASDDGCRGSFIDVRLKCSESDQLAKVKLSVVDPAGQVLASDEKECYFTDSKEAHILSVRQNDFLSCFGLKNSLLPGGAMTLLCEVDLLNGTDYNFCRRKEFEDSVLNSGAYERKLFSSWHMTLLASFFICLIILLAVLACLIHAAYVVLNIICLIIWYYVRYFLEVGITFCSAVVIIFFLFNDIERKGRKILRRRSKKCTPKHRSPNFVPGKKLYREPQQWFMVAN